MALAASPITKSRLCFAFAFWNERDPILKERLFGVTGPQGNHGEDVKEIYWYTDSTPIAQLHADDLSLSASRVSLYDETRRQRFPVANGKRIRTLGHGRASPRTASSTSRSSMPRLILTTF